MRNRGIWIGVAAALFVAALIAPGIAGAKAKTVTMSGKAYAFNHMDTFLEGATIRVREFPKLKAKTNAQGDYKLKLPDDETVTPYIVPPDGYNEIDLQTLHTRGKDIENANFQTPADLEYGALAALLGVPMAPNGRPAECVIVTTASARNVRGVDYATFEERTPHGVAGATASASPRLADPTYFNESVIPDPSQESTSGDGGIIWTEVPAGTYRISTEAPDHRFASFLATCENGRVVNANPPWGAYELVKKEKPLGASIAAGSVKPASATRKKLKLALDAAEPLDARVKLERRGRTVTKDRFQIKPGYELRKMRIPRKARGKRVKLVVKLRDIAGDKAKSTKKLKLPK